VEERNVPCPAPQTGTIRQRRVFTLNPHPTCWTATDNWTEVSNNCADPSGPTCGDPPGSPPTRNVPCPAGYEGTITEEATWNPVPHPTCWEAGAPWREIANTCVPREGPSCPQNPPGPLPPEATVACSVYHAEPTMIGAGVTTTAAWRQIPPPNCWEQVATITDRCVQFCLALQYPNAEVVYYPNGEVQWITFSPRQGVVCTMHPGGSWADCSNGTREHCP
jgi:hypothetical protein